MSNYSEALAFAAAYCSSTEHCISEVLDKTSKFELNEEEQAKMIHRLMLEGFIDEKRFVNAYVNDKFRFNKWGRIKIRFMLRQKGIADSIIQERLATISDEEYQNTLLTLLKQKQPSVKSKSGFELRAKMLRYGAGRGFEPAIISQCLKKLDPNGADESYDDL